MKPSRTSHPDGNFSRPLHNSSYSPIFLGIFYSRVHKVCRCLQITFGNILFPQFQLQVMPFLGMRFDSSLKSKNPNQHVHISISYLQSLPRMPPGRAMGYIQRSTVHRSGSIPDDRQINHDTYKLSAERLSLLHTGISMVLSKLNHDQMANNIFRSLCQNGEHKNKQNGHTAVF